LDFLVDNLKTLKKGGLAVHTSEFNLTSDEKTLESKDICIFREKDIREISKKLEQMGHYVYPLNFEKGNEILDNFIDFPPPPNISPFQLDFHLRINLFGFASTSFGIIIKKGYL